MRMGDHGRVRNESYGRRSSVGGIHRLAVYTRSGEQVCPSPSALEKSAIEDIEDADQNSPLYEILPDDWYLPSNCADGSRAEHACLIFVRRGMRQKSKEDFHALCDELERIVRDAPFEETSKHFLTAFACVVRKSCCAM